MIGELDRREFMKGVILQTGALAALSLRGEARSEPGRIPPVAFRIASPQWATDERFQALLDFFERHPGTVDELAFFTSATHPPLPLDEIERRAVRLQAILPRVRKQGMQAGINVLATVGHHEENLDHSLNTSWQRVMDSSGRVSLGSYCPSHPELIEYARKVYAAMAAAGPDFLWIDDDIRLAGHLPVTYVCFCDLCVRQFSEQVGTRFTRETLVAAFDAGSLEERLHLRREWLEHNRRVIDNLLRNLEEATHKVRAGLPLGLMTGDRFYEGYGFERWAETLAGPGQAPVRWRPGEASTPMSTPWGWYKKLTNWDAKPQHCRHRSKRSNQKWRTFPINYCGRANRLQCWKRRRKWRQAQPAPRSMSSACMQNRLKSTSRCSTRLPSPAPSMRHCSWPSVAAWQRGYGPHGITMSSARQIRMGAGFQIPNCLSPRLMSWARSGFLFATTPEAARQQPSRAPPSLRSGRSSFARCSPAAS